MGRCYDHHVHELVEVGVENFRSMASFSYNRKITPKTGSKPLIVFIGEGFETVEELKHLKEVLLDLLRGEGVPHPTHCAVRLKKSGTTFPRIELVEVGGIVSPTKPWRKRLRRPEKTKKKVKNVKGDALLGTLGRIYIPDHKVGDTALPNKTKGVKRERREAKVKDGAAGEHTSKKQKQDAE
ncbi:Ribosome production factor 2-like protein [Drosera capensis]